MACVDFTSWWKQSRGWSTLISIIGRITVVSMLIDVLIRWLMTGTVMYRHHWSCLPALHRAMLGWSGKRKKVFIQKLASQSWMRKDVIARATSWTRMMLVRSHPVALTTGRMLLTSPGVADRYTFLINTWNTLPESYQQWVYKNTLATVKHQIQQAENPTPA